MNNYCVYKHTSPNGKCYIGITGQNPIRRWNAGHGYKKNLYFYRAILKYGWNNFRHEILYTNLTKEQAEHKEIELIVYYNSTNPQYGFNSQEGGNATNGLFGEKNPMYGVDRFGNKNPFYGKHHSEETKIRLSEAKRGKYKGSNNPFAKKIVCLTTNEVFGSLAEAVEKYKLNHSYLSRVCKNQNLSCGKLDDGTKLKWMYYDAWKEVS